MKLASDQISYLCGVRNGYAEFAVGKGKGKRWGLIDRNGEVVAEPVFREAMWRLDNGRYIPFSTTASFNPPLWLFDTESGTWVGIEPNCRPWPVEGHDGLFWTFTRRGRCGIRNSKGQLVLPEQYGGIGCVGRNFFVKDPQTGRIGIFDPDGEQVLAFSLSFDKVLSDLEYPALAQRNGKWFLINDCGEYSAIAMPDEPDSVKLYGDRIVYGYKDRSTTFYGMLDTECREILPPIYRRIHPFNGKYFECELDLGNGRTCTGLANHEGFPVTPMLDGALGSIDADDDLMIVQTASLRDPGYCDYGLFRIQDDRDFMEIIPPRYVISFLDNYGLDWIVVTETESTYVRSKLAFRFRHGLFSLNGRQLVPFEYEKLLAGNDPERIAAYKDGEWFFINLNNERALEVSSRKPRISTLFT